MTKPSIRVLRIGVIASLIVGSSFAIHAQFQDDAPGASFNQGANALVIAAINLNYTNNQVNRIRAILQNRGFTVTV